MLASSPSNRKVPIFISTLSPLGALATRIRLKYPYDIMPHAILLQTIIEAPPSTGKRCFAEVVRQIIEPTLEARAQLNELIEQNGLDTEARFFISQWKSNGWIIKLRKNVYQKQI